MKNETQRGWWRLNIEGIKCDVSDATIEHIAEMIKQGCSQGEIIEDPIDD